MKENEAVVIENGEIAELDGVLKLSKPYIFEGKTYTEIDLSGLENIKAIDMIEANKLYDRSGGFSIMPELSMEYAFIIASKATNKPIELFYGLPPVLSPDDGKTIRKIIIQLSIRLRTSIEYLSNLSVFELFEIVSEVSKLAKK